MKKRIGLFLMSFFAFASYAQDVNLTISKLKWELNQNPDSKKIASIYSDLTWFYSTVSTDSALQYGKKAILKSKEVGDSTLIAQVYSDIGAVYFRKGDFKNSKNHYLTAYQIRKNRKDYKGLAKINNNLGNIYEKNQEYHKAMSSLLEALDYFEEVNDQKNANVAKGNIGLLLLKLKNYPKAVKYISEVIQYQEENNFTDELCVSYLNLGNVYLKLNDTLNAVKLYNKSLKACKTAGNKKGIASGYNNLASIKTEQNKSQDAIALYQQSQKAREQLNTDLDKAEFDMNLGKEYFNAKKYAEAKQLLLSSKKKIKKDSLYDKLQFNYKSLIEVCSKLNETDSINFYVKKIVEINTLLIENSAVKATAELETKYQTEKKEKLLLEKEAETQHKNNLLWGVSLLAFFIGLTGLLIYRQQKLKNVQQDQEFQLKTAIQTIESQNKLHEQRLNISKDLHDNIGAQLTFIISSVDNIKYAFDITNPKLNKKLNGIANFTKDTIVELRDTIWAMNHNEISFEDLKSRIYNFIEKAKESKENIDFVFTIDEQLNDKKFSSVVGMNIYRTIQEGINNAIKHSEASQITVQIKKIAEQILIEILDNGNGFDLETVSKNNGLNNMENRIASINGTFKIESNPDFGTKISILLNNTTI